MRKILVDTCIFVKGSEMLLMQKLTEHFGWRLFISSGVEREALKMYHHRNAMLGTAAKQYLADAKNSRHTGYIPSNIDFSVDILSINWKDKHLVSAAVFGECDYILTEDTGFIKEYKRQRSDSGSIPIVVSFNDMLEIICTGKEEEVRGLLSKWYSQGEIFRSKKEIEEHPEEVSLVTKIEEKRSFDYLLKILA